MDLTKTYSFPYPYAIYSDNCKKMVACVVSTYRGIITQLSGYQISAQSMGQIPIKATADGQNFSTKWRYK